MNKQRLAMVVSSVIGAISVFLNFVGLKAVAGGQNVDIQSFWGMKTQYSGLDYPTAILALIGFLAIAGLSFVGNYQKELPTKFRVGQVVLAVFNLLMAIITFAQAASKTGQSTVNGYGLEANFGLGIWLLVLASVAVLVVPFVIEPRLTSASFKETIEEFKQ